MNVFSISTMLLMYVVEAQLILNGSTGKLLAMQPALLPIFTTHSTIAGAAGGSNSDSGYCTLVAFTTLQKVSAGID